MKHKSIVALSSVIGAMLLVGCGGSNNNSSQLDSSSSDSTIYTLVINEVVASAIDDGADWIELYALADIADLSVYSVTDDNTNREPQSLPAISLDQGEYLVIQAIDEEDTPPENQYYVTFKLGGDDAVMLYQNSQQIDQLDWEDGDAEEGYSYGLYVDGTGTAQTMLPTEGATNEELNETVVVTDTITNNDAELRINEIVAKASAEGEDWIEFYATGNLPVFLGDYSVSDEDSELFSLPNVTIAAGEFYRIYATSDDISDADTVDFKLGSADKVSLFLDTDLIDQLSWDKGAALIGTSYGRYPDGSDALETLIPSPVTANTLATRGPLVINEVVATHVDEGNDWFELYNNSDTSIL
ncbi:MAG: lamin tail domain-containing protein, partial [Paraglaciecola sp.]|uniref:lamin tail domain-containing protein n=1 Tax=Paraglaciecola sp. TaxID=1920173 RepID=UPI00329900E5